MTDRRSPVPHASLALLALLSTAAFALALNPYWLAELAFYPDRPNPIQALTCLFLHVDIFHLLGNLVFLAAVGPAVEFAAGKPRFLLIYFLAGLFGVGVHWGLGEMLGFNAPLVGASGAIAGCVGYATVRYMSLRVPVLPGIGVPVGAVALVWVALQALGAILGADAFGDGPAYWVHLGGFVAGVLLGLLMRAPKQASVQCSHRVIEEMNLRGPAASLAAADRHLESHPEDIRALRHRAEALRDLGRPEDAAAAYVHLLRADDPEARVEALNALEHLDRLDALNATDRLRLVDDLKSEPKLAEALLKSVVDGPDDEPRRPDAILQLALMQEPEAGRETAAILVRDYTLHPATEAARAKGLLE